MIKKFNSEDIFMWQADDVFARDIKDDEMLAKFLYDTARRFFKSGLDKLIINEQQAFAMPFISFKNKDQKPEVSFSNGISKRDFMECFSKYDEMTIQISANPEIFVGLQRLIFTFDLRCNIKTQEVPLTVIGEYKRTNEAWKRKDDSLEFAISLFKNMMLYGAPVSPKGEI